MFMKKKEKASSRRKNGACPLGVQEDSETSSIKMLKMKDDPAIFMKTKVD
jgi:hypothetical protein